MSENKLKEHHKMQPIPINQSIVPLCFSLEMQAFQRNHKLWPVGKKKKKKANFKMTDQPLIIIFLKADFYWSSISTNKLEEDHKSLASLELKF